MQGVLPQIIAQKKPQCKLIGNHVYKNENTSNTGTELLEDKNCN